MEKFIEEACCVDSTMSFIETWEKVLCQEPIDLNKVSVETMIGIYYALGVYLRDGYPVKSTSYFLLVGEYGGNIDPYIIGITRDFRFFDERMKTVEEKVPEAIAEFKANWFQKLFMNVKPDLTKMHPFTTTFECRTPLTEYWTETLKLPLIDFNKLTGNQVESIGQFLSEVLDTNSEYQYGNDFLIVRRRESDHSGKYITGLTKDYYFFDLTVANVYELGVMDKLDECKTK